RGWFDAGVTCVGMGSKLISNEILANEDFEGLKTKVAETLIVIKKIRR
ncbi:MAG: bifunctional 4-hydroxy-2-oxoglutarate aldolase/2-dehydro-3-deoxy-phosphogluconate aldolase, partial [Bacteroidota bacterium]|nr:bifunctional 4-hydroxy-2-oxoglutarate aldolase/2-dehydro-3-deoxy-phosphogluconate aldolase [Bacteroidota bacterium]